MDVLTLLLGLAATAAAGSCYIAAHTATQRGQSTLMSSSLVVKLLVAAVALTAATAASAL